jgi:hypothetical protein
VRAARISASPPGRGVSYKQGLFRARVFGSSASSAGVGSDPAGVRVVSGSRTVRVSTATIEACLTCACDRRIGETEQLSSGTQSNNNRRRPVSNFNNAVSKTQPELERWRHRRPSQAHGSRKIIPNARQKFGQNATHSGARDERAQVLRDFTSA